MNPERIPARNNKPVPQPIERDKSGERERTPTPLEAEMLLFQMTPVEFRLMQETSPGDKALEDLLKRKRIRVGMGNVVIEVAGKRHLITTVKEDFGTEINRNN